MGKTAQDVLNAIKNEGIELIDLKFTDLHGKWQHLTVCADLVDEDAFGHWVYLPMEGDGELEAITLQVNPEGRILDIEWGKDWKSG